MANRYSFKNYKIFKDEQVLELRPITIVFGKNNSGKSALLKFPLMFESTLKCNSTEVFDLKPYEGLKLGEELIDVLYGKALRAVECEAENAEADVKLAFRFYVDKSGAEQHSHIEYWKLVYQGQALEVKWNGDSYSSSIPELGNISFRGAVLVADNVPGFVAEAIKALKCNIDYIGPIRVIPNRDMRIDSDEEKISGYKGENTYNVLLKDSLTGDKQLTSKVSEWYSKNFDNWALRVDDLRAPVYHVELVNDNLKNNILDTGYGIVQSLPVVIRACQKCEDETLIILEEPETHLHPAAHGNMAQLIAESVQEDRNKKYLIETHSLNFIMRLRRLVAEGVLGVDDVNLIYVDFEKEDVSSSLKVIPIKEDGSVVSWPSDVFYETMQEVMAIKNAQFQKKI